MPTLRFLLLCLGLAFATASLSATPGNDAVWQQFKQQFLTADGRVIDRMQNDISHSEGQAYAMLLALHFNDQALFDRSWQWVSNNLQVRRDALSAWSWGKRANDDWRVIDYNNATDGDVLLAYALLLADKTWHQAAYGQRAAAIIESLRQQLAVKQHDRSLLLPGYHGFSQADGLVVNPSYLIISAYQAFAEHDDQAFWRRVERDAVYLLAEASHNAARLPADWLLFENSGQIKIHAVKSTCFGYEAIRVPLYLAWAKQTQPAGMADVLSYYEKQGRIPLWIDLTHQEMATENASAGFYAIYARVAEQLGKPELAARLKTEATQRLEHESKDYYSYVLYLLADIFR